MQLYDFAGSAPFEPKVMAPPAGHLPFAKGDNVHDVAYNAYLAVMAKRADEAGQRPAPSSKRPEPNTLRLVFPPST